MANSNEARWLDADEQAIWLALVGMVIRLPQELDRQLRSDVGISHFEYMVLVTLSAAPDRTKRMSELAGLVEGSLPRLSQVVTKLERTGWVARKSDPNDGRFTLATLTDLGQAKLVEAAPGHVERVRQLVFDPLTKKQLAELGQACQGILGVAEGNAPKPGKNAAS